MWQQSSVVGLVLHFEIIMQLAKRIFSRYSFIKYSTRYTEIVKTVGLVLYFEKIIMYNYLRHYTVGKEELDTYAENI